MTRKNRLPVFVYGTLKQGFHNNWILSEYGGDFVCETQTIDKFLMWEIGFPLIKPPRDAEDVLAAPITGELWLASRMSTVRMDHLENNGVVYQRELTPLANGVTAWTYLWMGHPMGRIVRPQDGTITYVGDRWRAHE